MNQRFLSSLTAALMIMSCNQALPAGASEPAVSDDHTDDEFSQAAAFGSSEASSEASPAPRDESAVKVGEYQSEEQLDSADDSVAAIYAHQMESRYAATLYVRDIPVLTTVGEAVGARPEAPSSEQANLEQADLEQAKIGQPASAQPAADDAVVEESSTELATGQDYTQDPVWRATAIAARLNQAYRNQLDPSAITAHWDSEQERFLIRLGDEVLVTVDSRVVLSDTTGDEVEDVLQMANRIRRQLGAEPLSEVEGLPEPVQQVAVGPVRVRFSGMASWYGPGFHGRQSASGEVFNQHALTAAHPSLPFGTLLQVTNTNTGSTVTVRVNDRGPYAGHRVIDLSAAAAEAIGMLRAGVAPVRVEVLGE
ncbi:MAG: septal ring lytic transglycosylase RlpA family protein [Elainellaceae cyanobacterium]